MESVASAGSWVRRLALWPGEGLLYRRFGWFSGGLLVLLGLNELSLWGGDVRRWDWLFVTGILAFLMALRPSLALPDKMHETLDRLGTGKVLSGPEDLQAFERNLHRSSRWAALVGGAVTVPVIAVAWIAARGLVGRYLGTMTAEVVAAVPVGLCFGRTVGYGLLGRRLTRSRFTVTVDPEHLDGATGLRPVGDFYFFQAMLLAVPAVFLGAWWVAIPFYGERYEGWRDAYVALLAIVLVCELLAFLLPLWSFHIVMKEEKRRLLAEADEIGHQALEVQRQLRSEPKETQLKHLEDRLARLTRRYQAIEKMPTWPVSTRVRRRLALNNVILLTPVVAQILGAPDSLQHLLDALQKVITGHA
ncbi:hypothetical protein GCM10023195_76740 [Actinoallomurus liliacearum]|uniref:Uncharacterized protein n=1 Tax=Actinoallomurus liliacearum TaxID=1080073 RepID=A0ABP8TZA5_9ACTN